MAEVVLFHHALGLTRGVIEFADKLRGAGHLIHTPDLFEGRTFPSIDQGMAHGQTLGFETIANRGEDAVDGLTPHLVYAGFSLGVVPAQKLAQTRPGAAGGLFFYACVPASYFGAWPVGLPAQIHGMDADPYFVHEGDIDAARVLAESTDRVELYLYGGNQHYFADSTLSAYDEPAASLMTTRVLDFLENV